MITSMPAPSFLPSTAVLEMTYKCNHSCRFCSCPWYAGAISEDPEMNVAEWQELIATLCQKGICSLAFTGGEPLLKEGLSEIIDFAAAQSAIHIETVDGELKKWHAPPKLYLLSNGKAMHRDILALCKKYDINLSMSLPGLTTFAAHTNGGLDAGHVLEWFKTAKEYGVRTTAGITVTSENFHELYETIAMALLSGADTILLNRFMPGGRGLQHRELELTLEQIKAIPDIAEEVLSRANRFGNIGTELPRCVVDPTRYKHLKVGTRCSAAVDFFVIDPSGYIRVCNHSPKRLNHCRDLEELKHHPYWQKFVFKKFLPEACAGCGLTGECDGGCREAAHVVSGFPEAPDPIMASVK